MPMKIKPQMLRNITKSLGYATTSAFGDLMPTVKSTMQNNSNYIAEVYSSSKEKLTPADIQQTYPYKSATNLIRNAINDLKSGELFNKKRQDQAEQDFFKDIGFDFNFDFNGDTGNGASSSDENAGSNSVNNNIFMMDTGVNETIESGVSRLSSLATSTMKLNQLNASVISKQLSTMVAFQNDNTVKYYNDISTKLGDMASNMAQMTGFLGIISEVSVGGIKQGARKTNSSLPGLLGMEGLDIEGYKDIYQKKFLGNGGLKDTFNLLLKPVIDKWIANPIGNLMKTGIKAVLPKAFKSALGEFDQMFKYLPTMIQGKMDNLKGSDNGLKKWLGNTLGLDLTQSKRLDFSNYEKGKVSFDGITRRAIVNVMPSLLSKILASVSKNPLHQEELIYDYDEGRFTTRKRSLEGIKNNIKNYTVDGSDMKTYKEQIAKENAGKFDEEGLKGFMDRVDKTLLELVKKNTIITGNTKLEDISKDKDVAEAVKNNFNNQSNSGKARYQHDMLDSSKSYYDVFDEIMDNESFHNIFDIDKSVKGYKSESNDEMIKRLKEASAGLDPNSKVGKLLKNILPSDYNDDEFNVENNLNKNNPFYWMTKELRKGNSKISDLFMGENKKTKQEENAPIGRSGLGVFGDIAKSIITDDDENNADADIMDVIFGNEKLSEANRRGIFASQSSDSSGAIGSTAEMTSNLADIRNILGGDNSIKDTISSINSKMDGLKQSIFDTTKSSTAEPQSTGTVVAEINTNDMEDKLSLLSPINDNIAHISELLEAKLTADGMDLGKMGRTKSRFSYYKDKTLGFFDKIFKKDTQSSSGISKIGDSIRGFFSSFGGKKSGKGNEKSKGLFGGIFSAINDARKGDNTAIKTLLGKDGVITNFLTGIFNTTKDLFEKYAPKVKNGLSTLFGGIFTFAQKILKSVFDFTSDKLKSGKDFLDSHNTKGGGIKGLFSAILGGASSITGKVSDFIGGIGKGDNKSKSKKKFKFSISEIFDKVFNPKEKTLHVYIEGGNLDDIRKVIRVKIATEDENSDEEQIANFQKDSDEREETKAEALKKKDNVVEDALKKATGSVGNRKSDENSGGSAAGNLVSNVAGEAIGNAIGSKFGGKGIGGAIRGIGKKVIDNKAGRTIAGSATTSGIKGIGSRIAGSSIGRGVKSLLGKFGIGGAEKAAEGVGEKVGGKVLLKGLAKGAGKLIPGGALALGALDSVKGFATGGKAFSENPTLGQRFAGAGGSLLGGLSFGLLNEKSMSQGLYNMFGGKKKKKSYASGGVVDYTGTANVHGSRNNPEMVLNSGQTSGLYSFIREMSLQKEQERIKTEQEKKKGEFSNDPAIKTANWIEKLGKFFSPKGIGGTLFGGMLGGILGKAGGFLSGVAGKVGSFFKGLFGKLFSGGSSDDSTSGDFSGDTNTQVAWNFFKSKGFSDQATSGILGNLKQESGINPNSQQQGGPGMGIAQWSKGGRWDQLVSWANGQGLDPKDIKTQLQYLYLEMTQKETTGISILNKKFGGMNTFKNTSDTNWATNAFQTSYERAGSPNMTNRNNYANNIFNTYKGTQGTGGDPSSSISGSARDKIVKGAQTFVGKLSYSFGGTNIKGGSGDCSAYVQYIMKQYGGMSIGRTTGDQVMQGTQVSDGQEQPGDLVFFKDTYKNNNPYGCSHVGIVIGGGKMVNLANSGCSVVSYRSGYFGQHYLMCRSYLGGGSSTSTATTTASNFDSQAQQTRSGWFQDVWGSQPAYAGGASGSNDSYNNGPFSSYIKSGSLANLGSISGSALGNGSAYVGGDINSILNNPNSGSTTLDDLRLQIGNSVIQNASSSLIGSNTQSMSNLLNNSLLNSSGIPNNITSVSSLKSGGTDVSGLLPSTVLNNKTINDMLKNSDDISMMQSLLKQINETGQKGNETLAKMLDVLTEIREQNKNNSGSQSPVLINAGNTSSRENVMDLLSPSSEMSSLEQGY